MKAKFNQWFSKKEKEPSPTRNQSSQQKQTTDRVSAKDKSLQSQQDSVAVKTGTLPENFHERVVELEMKVDGSEYKEDETQLVNFISELMQLYSVSINAAQTLQLAIEFYNRETDESHQTYYVEKLSKLNDDIRTIVDRQNRIITRSEAQEPQQRPRTSSVNTLPTPKNFTAADRKRIQDDLKLKLFDRIQKEQGKDTSQIADQIIQKTEQSTVTLKKDMMDQTEQLQQRLAERRRSRGPRSSSLNDSSLSFNFSVKSSNTIRNRKNSIGPFDSSGPSLVKQNTQPVVQQSRIKSPQRQSESLPTKQDNTNTNDDATSQNKSATSQGTGLANKISLAISRILQNTSTSRVLETDEEVADLISLIEELNTHTELKVKLSSTSKVSKILSEVGGNQEQKKDIFSEIQLNKVASLNFKSKMKLEMKSMVIDPQVRQILDKCLQELEKLQEEKDQEIEAFMEEHAELKFKMNQDVKKKFNMKIMLAQKNKDESQLAQLNAQLKEEQKKCEVELQEKSTTGKNDIKDKFNFLAQQVQIDTQALVQALINNSQVKI